MAGAVLVATAAHAHALTQPTRPTQTTPAAQPQTQAPTCPGGDVATHQTSNAFSSINDGQPGTPWQPQITAIPSFDFGEEEFQGQFLVQNVFFKSGFGCQAYFGVNAPTLMLGESLIDFEKSLTANWQQRWFIDDGTAPTISSIVAIQWPYDEPDEDTDLVLTGIVVKSVAFGAFYLNLFAETSGGIDIDNFEFGGLLGMKQIITDHLAGFGDIVIQEQGQYALEFSVERDFNKGWTLGPGVSFQRDDSDDFDVSVGINIVKVFGGN